MCQRLVANLGAGLTVGIVALAMAMAIAMAIAVAFAIAWSVKPEQAIFTEISAVLLISAPGGSKVQVGGPAGPAPARNRLPALGGGR